MSFDLVISNGIIISVHNCYAPLIGSIGISNGYIDYIGERSIPAAESKEIIDAAGKIVLPGLINGHCHGDMTMARGAGEGLTLKEQTDLYNPINWFYDVTTDEDRYYSRVLTYIEAVLSGTTFILENAFWGMGENAIKAFKSVGIKGGLVEDIAYDFKDPGSRRTPEDLSEFRNNCDQNAIVPVLGGILEEYYTPSVLEYQSKVANQAKSLLTAHLSETVWRKKILDDTFHSTSVKILKDYGILNDKYIGSHGVYVSNEDIQLLRQYDAKIVNTPICEMKIADGIAPIPELIENGVVVGLGTDGAMWNNSNDMFGEMKVLALVQTVSKGIRSLKTETILDMATINGAKIFGLDHEIGSLEEGKKADIILIDGNQPHIAPLRTHSNPNIASSVVFSATGRDVTDVIIDGNHIVENGRLLTLDVQDVLEKVTYASEKIGHLLKEVM